MTLTIMVKSLDGLDETLEAVKAMVKKGDVITSLFFYEAATGLARLDSGALSRIQSEFVALSKAYEIPLAICLNAADRRGIVEGETCHPDFRISSLGQFFAAAAQCEKSRIF